LSATCSMEGKAHMANKGSITLAALFFVATQAEADGDDVLGARVMWAAFECSIFAELSANPVRQGALFERGYSEGQAFFAAAEAGDITEEEWRTHVPIAVPLLSSGPSIDFVLGRIFETVAGEAFDDVVTKDANGLPLQPEEWVQDPELRVIRAQNLYRDRNCDLF